MDNYEWQKNKAVVDRMYYSERCLFGTTLVATGSTVANLVFIRNNYFAQLARSRFIPTWRNWALVNLVVISVLLKPLTTPEIKQQWRKRLVMGKYLYTLYHMESPEEIEAAHLLALAEKE
jgi:hypothetical protein